MTARHLALISFGRYHGRVRNVSYDSVFGRFVFMYVVDPQWQRTQAMTDDAALCALVVRDGDAQNIIPFDGSNLD